MRVLVAHVSTAFRTVAVLCGALLPALAWTATPLHHDLHVRLDLPSSRLHVRDRIRIGADHEVVLRLPARFSVERFVLDGRSVMPAKTATAAGAVWYVRVRAPADRAATVEVSYTGELDRLDTALDHRQVLGLSGPFAGAEGAFLGAATKWYPHSEHDLITYRMQVVVPAGFRAVAPGKVLTESPTARGFKAVFEAGDALPGIDLLAGPYAVSERIVRLASGREVRVRTYFHAEIEELADKYLHSAAGYLGRYDRTIGPYAFASYSIVSSPLPTGFGMPGIAYLGRRVLRLPFIRATSLGHEVLHDWWGNGVFPDYARGNWSEGLTTFLADYAYKEDQGSAQAQAMRLAWLRDFAAVRPEQDRPLVEFVSRTHGADQAVGYHKTAFVFFMLRALIGDESFRAGVRRFWLTHRFRVASWDDLRQAFESVSGRDLQGFFTQWITRPGAARIDIASARRVSIAGGHRLVLQLQQAAIPYWLEVPLRMYLANGKNVDAVVELHGPSTQVALEVPDRVLAVAIDPDVRLFRRLDQEEIAPILRQVTYDRRTALVQTSSDQASRKAALAIAVATLEHAPNLWNGKLSAGAMPLFIAGLHADVADFLARHALTPVPRELLGRGSAFVYAGRTGSDRSYVVVSAQDAAALAALTRALPHLGAQSFIVFDGARPIERGVWPTKARRYLVTD